MSSSSFIKCKLVNEFRSSQLAAWLTYTSRSRVCFSSFLAVLSLVLCLRGSHASVGLKGARLFQR
ncbi:hypothetical protein KFK09_002478 [Dendrobium nobile]|uniref:Uncharacterized protein n=1 Tax=Dendrobium nobile TaxID=94219 RepID=A0A8T3C534_DENNO|nr:hypothetical protein KFK09_002478 [Dendrobium nobile]